MIRGIITYCALIKELMDVVVFGISYMLLYYRCDCCVTEYINTQLYELARKYHQAMVKFDISDISSAPSSKFTLLLRSLKNKLAFERNK